MEEYARFLKYVLVAILSFSFHTVNLVYGDSLSYHYVDSDNGITVEWASNHQITTNFTMTSSSLTKGNYFAFGLSTDQNMVIFSLGRYLFAYLI